IIKRKHLMSDTYQIDQNIFEPIDGERPNNCEQPNHKPKVLLLYGSLRKRSFSRLMTEEASFSVFLFTIFHNLLSVGSNH
ncbi:MAG: hypothetical protein VW352_06390, partial [Gammaproteobacteria bacterium]